MLSLWFILTVWCVLVVVIGRMGGDEGEEGGWREKRIGGRGNGRWKGNEEEDGRWMTYRLRWETLPKLYCMGFEFRRGWDCNGSRALPDTGIEDSQTMLTWKDKLPAWTNSNVSVPERIIRR